MPPFKKVLIANRGEIAVRVMRACRELGVSPVAVYSDADASALHLSYADEAIRIGGAAAADSYLRGERIIEAALQVGAEAIHPGYGFLSEREWFARAVLDAGLIFVGPSPDAIAKMGSKTSARTMAEKAKVPVVPGTTVPLADASEASAIAAEMGYPVLLKASAGGGGKGMRLVHEAAEMQGAYDAARRESKASFGDDAIYVEKYIAQPRHVEIQILGDNHGNLIHLGERECSIQRRHQKMVEECPSLAVSETLRETMGSAAVRVAHSADYSNAGTCEFLLAQDGSFYFLEMNTRLQVEHPVTELVMGIDIVQWQLRVAAGERLTIRQEDISPRGWAIECRITSEDTAQGFLPSSGTVTHLAVPQGPGIRWDSGIGTGSTVGTNYDPMLAKLIVWGEDRPSAISRMRRALSELSIVGVDSSREFHAQLLSDPDFIAGDFHVQWLESKLDSLLQREAPADLESVAALLAVHLSRSAWSGVSNVSGGGDSPAPAHQVPRAGVHGWPRAEWRNDSGLRND